MTRVSIFNCVSTALDMLKFSTEAIIKNAGTKDFDYIVITWRPSKEVTQYLNNLVREYFTGGPDITILEYQTNPDVGFVPNLRGMMNLGFQVGFDYNDYCGLVNTDMYFGKDWLKNLVKYTSEDTIVNSVHITPISGPHVITANLGMTEFGKFDMEQFNQIYKREFEDKLEHEDARGGWLATNTMPYLIPKKYWEAAGPWELTDIRNSTPDRRFFQRCHDAGAKFTMAKGSIVYHAEGVERKGKRPNGTKHMVYDE